MGERERGREREGGGREGRKGSKREGDEGGRIHVTTDYESIAINYSI